MNCKEKSIVIYLFTGQTLEFNMTIMKLSKAQHPPSCQKKVFWTTNGKKRGGEKSGPVRWPHIDKGKRFSSWIVSFSPSGSLSVIGLKLAGCGNSEALPATKKISFCLFVFGQ